MISSTETHARTLRIFANRLTLSRSAYTHVQNRNFARARAKSTGAEPSNNVPHESSTDASDVPRAASRQSKRIVGTAPQNDGVDGSINDVPHERPVLKLRAPSGSEKFDKRLKRRVPWIFANEIENIAELRERSVTTKGRLLVNVINHEEKDFGSALFNLRALLAGRVICDNSFRPIDEHFLIEQLQKSLSQRSLEPFLCRAVNGEGDRLPGLVIDRYNDVVSVQMKASGWDLLQSPLLSAVEKVFSPSALVVRNDTIERYHEEAQLWKAVVKGSLASPMTITEQGCSFEVDALNSPRTGWLFDRKHIRKAVCKLAEGGSVLDLFSYVGAFGIMCAKNGGAKSVVCVEKMETSVSLGKKAAVTNGVSDKVCFVQTDAVQWIDTHVGLKEQWDFVILDPPNLAPTDGKVEQATEKYMSLLQSTAKLVRRNGHLLAIFSSRAFAYHELAEMIADALALGGRRGRVVNEFFPPSDHPLHVALPKSRDMTAFLIHFTD